MFDGFRNKRQYDFIERKFLPLGASTGPGLNAVTMAVETLITFIRQKAMRHR